MNESKEIRIRLFYQYKQIKQCSLILQIGILFLFPYSSKLIRIPRKWLISVFQNKMDNAEIKSYTVNMHLLQFMTKQLSFNTGIPLEDSLVL